MQCLGTERRTADGPELRDRTPVAGHREALAGFDAIDDLASLVAQLADRDGAHGRNVSRRETTAVVDHSVRLIGPVP